MRETIRCLLLAMLACGGEKLAHQTPPAQTVDYGVAAQEVSYYTEPTAPTVEEAGREDAASLDLGPPCEDHDGDGFGPDCPAGNDCDDTNPWFNTVCPDCKAQIVWGCPCTEGAPPMSCYEGPEETRNKGECHDGRRFCLDGFWSYCFEQQTPAPEVCDHLDNDCDGETDEGAVSKCGSCSADTDCVTAGPDDPSTFYPNPSKNSQNVALDSNGNIHLSTKSGSGTSAKSARFIWIANSPENTVSRLDTSTGWEAGRYQVCTDPSRTAVDLQGNGIITCRGDGRVAKVAIFEEDCIDKDQDGQIETSHDTNGDHVITPDEMVNNDECVLWVTQPDGPGSSGCSSTGSGCARAAGVDKDNNVWVGFWNSKRLLNLNGETGVVIKSHNLTIRPYGLAIDNSGIIWVTSRSPCALARVHPDSGQTGVWNTPGSGCFYGIAIDPWGKVWLANYDNPGIHRFDPATSSFTHWFAVSGSTPRGVAVAVSWDTSTGNVLGAKVYTGDCPSVGGSSDIPVFDAKLLVKLPAIPLGFNGCPVGVAVDADGYLWTVNQNTSNATKVDLAKGAPVGTYPVGSHPYTYSDMTGYALRNFTLVEGYYRHIFTSVLEGKVQWVSLWVDASVPEGTWIKIRARAADDPPGLAGAQWTQKLGPFPPASFPANLEPLALLGHHLEVEIFMHSQVAKASPVVHGIKAFAKQVP